MKRNGWHKRIGAGLLLLSCAGMALTGCAARQAPPEVSFEDMISSTDDISSTDGISSTDIGESAPGEGTDGADPGTQTGSTEGDVPGTAVQDLYAQFLADEIPLTVGESHPQDGYGDFVPTPGDTYTFAELGQYVDESYFDPAFSQKTSHDHVQYARVSCPDSGSQALLVKYVGLDIYGPDDDSFCVLVIVEKDGQLYLTDGYECWARSYTEVYRNGLISAGGSNGAGDHSEGVSAVMSDGRLTGIRATEILTGWWAGSVGGPIYSEIFGEDDEILFSVLVHTIGGQQYYTYDLSGCTDDQKALCGTYIDRCRDEMGIVWTTEEEVDARVRERCAALGIDPALLDQKDEVAWLDL